MAKVNYTEDNIRSLDWREHIRMRPGMYIGKLGDGSSADDGIYILLKEIIDNSIDEYVMGFGKKILIKVEDKRIVVRDYGRGIPLGKVVDCVSKINTGGKYDSKAFKKSVGLNGVGTKAVNALSHYFRVRSIRDGKVKEAEFKQGELIADHPLKDCRAPNGTEVLFEPDETVFRDYRFRADFMESQLWNYAYLNSGLRIHFNDKVLHSKNGLLDLLERKTQKEQLRYPIIHLKGEDIEIAFSHGNHYGEQYYSFVNGQHTTQGGTHLNAFKEGLVKTIQDYFSTRDNQNFNRKDILASIIGTISVRVEE